MLSQYPRSAFHRLCGAHQRGQQQFATPTLRVHLLGIDISVMRCAKGIFAKGIWGGMGFSPLRWEKGSETPSCGGTRGLRLPRSSCSDLGSEGVSDPFSHRKREDPVPPKIPSVKIPSAQPINLGNDLGIAVTVVHRPELIPEPGGSPIDFTTSAWPKCLRVSGTN